jgi:hypothetical protein
MNISGWIIEARIPPYSNDSNKSNISSISNLFPNTTSRILDTRPNLVGARVQPANFLSQPPFFAFLNFQPNPAPSDIFEWNHNGERNRIARCNEANPVSSFSLLSCGEDRGTIPSHRMALQSLWVLPA